jgi:hypothetical protein
MINLELLKKPEYVHVSNSLSIVGAAMLFLAGCAIPNPPPPEAGHPASPLAPEGLIGKQMKPLKSDEVTDQTRKLLQQAQEENEPQNEDQKQMDHGNMKME